MSLYFNPNILGIDIKCFKNQNKVSIGTCWPYQTPLQSLNRRSRSTFSHWSKKNISREFFAVASAKGLQVYSIRIKLRTEINKYKYENFNSFAIDKTSLLCSSKNFSSIIQEMFERTTIDKSDFNKVTFLHGFSPIDLLRHLPMSGYLCLGFGTIERYWHCSNL